LAWAYPLDTLWLTEFPLVRLVYSTRGVAASTSARFLHR